jgi:hypothetical protein
MNPGKKGNKSPKTSRKKWSRSAESRNFHNRKSATCGYENSALSGLSGNKYDNHLI